MTDYIEWLKQQFSRIHESNPFFGLLKVAVDNIREGEAELSMLVSHQLTNVFGVAHGGAISTLADCAMGVACATLGSRVVTLDMNINFIRSAAEGDTMRSQANVIHSGKSTIVVENEIVDQNGNLLAKARGTFFVIGQFERKEN